jgi:putative ABC transport system ATP-binding protein
MKNQPLIKLAGIAKAFETSEVKTNALRGINLEIYPGEYLSISGPSGCGKSTLLGILGLIDSPSQGQYWWKGQPVAGLGRTARARMRNQQIGFVFQSFNLIGDLNVADNVGLPLSYRGVALKKRRQAAMQVLQLVGLDQRAAHYPAQLSGGQQQRVAVARALVTGPSLLLADEPTGNLDSENGEQVMALFQMLHQRGTTICMVTHDPRFAGHAARTVHMLDGKIVVPGAVPRRPAVQHQAVV